MVVLNSHESGLRMWYITLFTKILMVGPFCSLGLHELSFLNSYYETR